MTDIVLKDLTKRCKLDILMAVFNIYDQNYYDRTDLRNIFSQLVCLPESSYQNFMNVLSVMRAEYQAQEKEPDEDDES